MSLVRLPLFRRRMGQDIRAWPMLALLLLVVLVAIGCVAWFMREAMRNERLAVREKLAQAYRAQLELIRFRMNEEWRRQLPPMPPAVSAATVFATTVGAGWVDSAIIFEANGGVLYPQGSGEGRIAAANDLLLALEKEQPVAAELAEWLNDYSSPMPAPQRRFLMREFQRLVPGTTFATQAAEELAARYLEANPHPTRSQELQATGVPDVWAAASPDGRILGLFSTTTVRARWAALQRDFLRDKGLRLAMQAPGEEADRESILARASLAPEFPGWHVSLAANDRAYFDTEADRKIARLLWIGTAVIAAMTVLAVFIARGFGRQVQLARLKNDLVATVSHELKTPLTAMRALVDTLLDAEKFDEKTTREYLQLLSTENSRLSRLIDNFLTFSRLERNKFNFDFTRLAPQEVVAGAVAAMGERRHAIAADVPTSLPAILGDSDALVTVLLNLLDNAWKYSGDDKRIAVRAEAHNGTVRFAVEDHGVGLSAYERRRIFDRFYRGDERLTRTVGGCGLGLSIVQSIVAAHRGTVQVASEPGRGSTFTIEIPAAP